MPDTERIGKPELVIAGKKPYHAFPAEKTVKTMTFKIEKATPRKYNNENAQKPENYKFDHLSQIFNISLFIQRGRRICSRPNMRSVNFDPINR